MPELPILYSFRRCPYAIRARLALAISEISVELREVVLGDKPTALLLVSPKATVPVLQMPNGQIFEESLSIMQWALSRDDPAGWMYPQNEAAQRDAHLLITSCDGVFKQALDRCKYPQRHSAAEVDEAWSDAGKWLGALNGRLERQAALCTEKTGLADAAIFPFVRQFAAIDGQRWDRLPFTHLKTWLERWLSSNSFSAVMHKHLPWRQGSVPLQLLSPSQHHPK